MCPSRALVHASPLSFDLIHRQLTRSLVVDRPAFELPSVEPRSVDR